MLKDKLIYYPRRSQIKIDGGEYGEYWTMDEAKGKSPLSVRSTISGSYYDGGEDDG